MGENIDTFEMLPVEQILPNPDQPRTVFDQDELRSLSQSILEHGLIQPVRVEGPYSINGSGKFYYLVDGERRWRASKLANLPTIKSIISPPRQDPDDKRFLGAVIANLQRSDLNLIEEARAFEKLRKNGWLLRQISLLVGRTVGYIEFRLKLLELDPEILDLYANRKLPSDPQIVYGLLRLPAEIRVKIATRFAQKGMTAAGIKLSISRVNRNYGDEKDTDLTHRKTSPAMAMSEGPIENSRIFDSLSKKGITPEWELINEASKKVCDNCEIHDIASTKQCGDCPAVELITYLTQLAAVRK